MAGVSCDLVHKSASQRGRPRQFDPAEVLIKARDAFWSAGYQATSLDRLSEATGLKRPSLYGAFGDKQALYVKLLRIYRETNWPPCARRWPTRPRLRAKVPRRGLRRRHQPLRPQRPGLFHPQHRSRAKTRADVEVRRERCSRVTDDLDDAFAEGIRSGPASQGEMGAGVRPRERSRLATAVLSLAVGSRPRRRTTAGAGGPESGPGSSHLSSARRVSSSLPLSSCNTAENPCRRTPGRSNSA